MAPTLRRVLPPPVVQAPAPAATVEDADFGALLYVGGWWYGQRSFLGCEHVRLRICGTLHRPARRAMRALRQLRSDADHIHAHVDRRMWEMRLGCLEPSAARVTQSLQARQAQPPCYRLVAICAGAQPDERVLELAFSAACPAPHLMVAWRRGRIADPRPCPSVWQTPPLSSPRPA